MKNIHELEDDLRERWLKSYPDDKRKAFCFDGLCYNGEMVLRNKLTPLQIVITNGYTCSIFQVAKITKKGVWLCSLFSLIPIYLPSYF